MPRSMQRSSTRIDDYAEHVGARLEMIAAIDGSQPGDPKRGAAVFLALAEMDNPPTQLLLGAGVLATYRDKLAGIAANLDEWEATTLSADFPPGED